MTSRRYVVVGSIAVALCITAFFGVFGSALRQGDDNLKVLPAILSLPLSTDGLARIDDTTMIAWTHGGVPALKRYMEDRGWQYHDQMGSGYFFERDDQRTVVTTQQYSRFFTLFGMR
jgi:hypothetical protein